MALQLTPEQLQAFQQLSHAYQAQQEQIASLRQELRQMRVPATAAASVSSSSESTSVQRDDSHFGLNRLLSKPSVFHGEHGNRVLDWINEFDILFENCDPHMPESRKITFAKQFLRDEALRWWIAREQDVHRASAASEAVPIPLDTPAVDTWSQFKAVLRDYFSPRGASEAARNELHRLRQQQFRSLAAYADCFEATSRRIEVPPGHSIDEELVATFKAGLSDGQIRLFLTNKQPRSLYQATQLALQAESDLRVSGFHSGTERFGSGGRGSNAFASHRYDRRYYGAPKFFPRAGFAGPSHAPSQPSSERPSHATPMDLSLLAVAPQSRDSESDSEVTRHDHEAEETPVSESESGYGGFEETAEEQSDSCNVVQVEPKEPACQHCGCHVLRVQQSRVRPSKSGCWNCGQAGHLSRDCPKPHRQRSPVFAAPRSSSETPARGQAPEVTSKPRHF
jgi:hypothetical protein